MVTAPTDIGVSDRTGGWYLQASTRLPLLRPVAGDIPVPGDYDGDGNTDLAVFRPSNGGWYVEAPAHLVWRPPGDIPVPGDYDGDGNTDIAVCRPSNGDWYINGNADRPWGGPVTSPSPATTTATATPTSPSTGPATAAGSSTASSTVQWGLAGHPRPRRLRRRRHHRIAVFRPSNGAWFINGAAHAAPRGQPGDIPVPGDYDGDGLTYAIYRDDEWYINANPPPIRTQRATPHSPNDPAASPVRRGAPFPKMVWLPRYPKSLDSRRLQKETSGGITKGRAVHMRASPRGRITGLLHSSRDSWDSQPSRSSPVYQPLPQRPSSLSRPPPTERTPIRPMTSA